MISSASFLVTRTAYSSLKRCQSSSTLPPHQIISGRSGSRLPAIQVQFKFSTTLPRNGSSTCAVSVPRIGSNTQYFESIGKISLSTLANSAQNLSEDSSSFEGDSPIGSNGSLPLRKRLEQNRRELHHQESRRFLSSSDSGKDKEDDGLEPEAPETSFTNRRMEARMPLRFHSDRPLFIDSDRSVHKQILLTQNLKKEQARRKTASNVYRALVGNVVICVAKLGAWASSGSSSMLSEFIHSVVDCGNQALLLVGLTAAGNSPDRSHPYGYGKSVYFWALVSALGTFFLGAGVSMTHAVGDVMQPSLQEITWEVWSVLALSLAVDGYVLHKTIEECLATKPPDVSYWDHFSRIRDPATLAVLLEDGAACLGVVLACGGICMSHMTGNAIWDGIAGVGISALLGLMGLTLVRVNHRFLLGQAVDQSITDEIEKILRSRRSIDDIRSVQSQWISADTFSYKAEVDFDGTYLAARLMPVYQEEFLQIRDSMDEELQVLLALYAEDVMRAVEREVRHIESTIRKKFPGAEYIELEPMSMDANRLAIFDTKETDLKRIEVDALDKYMKSLRGEEDPFGDSQSTAEK